jgi:hypothetical protein
MKNKNQLLFPFLTVSLVAVMYCIAFHSERDKNRELNKILNKIKNENKTKCSDRRSL